MQELLSYFQMHEEPQFTSNELNNDAFYCDAIFFDVQKT